MRALIPLTRARRTALALGGATVLAAVAVTIGPSSAVAGPPITLPDLKIIVPTDLISIGTDPNTGHRILRFTHQTADVGSGPFEIDPTYDPKTGTSTFVQAIYNSPSPGVWNRDHTVPVAATGTWRPPSDYAFPLTRFTLNTVNPDGSPGRIVATSPKTDYCITGDYRLTGIPNTPDQTSPPQDDCNDPTKPLGWSVGWADEYDQTDAGQPIDLTAVPNGTYILHAEVDPQHVFTESSTSNDVTDTELQVSGDNVTVLSQSTPGTSPPGVSLNSPAAQAHVSGTVTLRASASATAPATIASVQFLLDGQPLGSPVTRPPYSFGWTIGSTRAGAHMLSARATDSQGGLATAAPVPVIVVKGAGGGRLTVRLVRWRRGVLTLRAGNVPAGARLSVELELPHHGARTLTANGGRLRVRTGRPRLVILRVLAGGRELGKPVVADLSSRPSVRILNPAPGQTVSGTVPLVAGASDALAVTSVRFLVDGKRLGKPLTRPPFVVRWRTVRARRGRHRISALATNAAGNTASSTVVVTVRNPAPPMTCFVMQAHLGAHGQGSATTPAFHTAAPGETLLAFVSADGPAGAGRQSATVGGAGLRWRLVERANGSSGDSEIWAATARAILSHAQVTSQLATGGYTESLSVVAFEGAGGVGSAAAASGPTGAASVGLRTKRATSLVFAVGNDWDHAVARVLPPGWVSLDQWPDPATGDTFWSQYTNQPTGRAGTLVRARVLAPTADQWNLAAVELTGSGD